MKVPRVTIEELKAKLYANEPITILDVRNPVDYGNSNVKLPGALHITLEEIESRTGEFDSQREVVAYCT